MPFNLKKYLPQSIINRFWHLPKAMIANLVYGFPSKNIKVIGVTGTSGKTTTTHLIYHLLHQSKYSTALISTISAQIGSQKIDIGLHVTNPDPFTLQKIIKKIKDQKFKYLVLEVTSHGLDQFRCWGIKFTYGVLLNLKHEHLDYHKTLQKYHQSKLKLIKSSAKPVLNSLDKNFNKAKSAVSKSIIQFQAPTEFSLPSTLIGSFNQENLAAAIAVVKDIGLTDQQIQKALKSFPQIKGRMEIVKQKPFKVIIDFAHKPDALKKALQAIGKMKAKSGRIISVFGCAGLRDVEKRPMMGKIASQLSDITILTAEDPRTEDVHQIISQIEAGFFKNQKKSADQNP